MTTTLETAKKRRLIKYYVYTIISAFMLRMLGKITADMYGIALPLLIVGLDAPEHMVKLSVSIYFAGIFIAGLISGPLSDALGSRKMFIGSCIAFLLGSVTVLITAHHIGLIVGRFIQALGAGALPGLNGLLTMDDKQIKKAISRASSFFSMLMACFPMLGLTISSFLQQWDDWRAVFYVHIGVCLAVLFYFLWIFKHLDVVNKHKNNFSLLKPKETLHSLLKLTKNKQYVAQALGYCIISSAIPIYYSLAAFIVLHHFNMKLKEVAILSLLPSVGFALGKSIWGFVKNDAKLPLLFFIGCSLALSSSVLMVVFVFLKLMDLTALSVLFSTYTIGVGLITSVVNKKATDVFPELNSTAGSFLNAKTAMCSSVLTFATASWVEASMLTLGLILVGLTVLTIIFYIASDKPVPKIITPVNLFKKWGAIVPRASQP